MLSDAERDIFDFKRVFVVLSNVCNCRCIMCNNEHHSAGRSSLSFEAVHQIATFARDNGVEVLDLAGGEPFQYPRIADLIREFGSSAMTLNIVTNGTIMTRAHLDAIAGAASLRLQVSTHGLGAVEDTIKARPSASKQVARTLDDLASVGAMVSIATVVQKNNLHQLVDIYRHFSHVPYTHHSFVMYEPMGDSAAMHIRPSDVRITPDRAEELREQMSAVIVEAAADGKQINLDYPLVDKYVERVMTESPARAQCSERPSSTCVDGSAGDSCTAEAMVLAGTSTLVADAASPGSPREKAGAGLSHPGLLCTIPRRNLFIDHNGDVRPCFHYDWAALNADCSIAGRSLEDLVFSREYLEMILSAVGPGGCPGCDAACYIWDPDFRRRATRPDKEDRLLALIARRETAAQDLRRGAGPGVVPQSSRGPLEDELRAMRESTSWRITAPMRRLGDYLRRRRT
jgi:MoaA/NifB/PqqE/SkfB family radical SAM enzyme